MDEETRSHLQCNPRDTADIKALKTTTAGKWKCLTQRNVILGVFALQPKQVKRTPQDSINELIIWKMRNEQWIIYENLSVFGQIENLWMN